MDIYDTDSSPRLHAVFLKRGTFPETVFSDAQERPTRLNYGHRDNFVPFPQGNPPDPVRSPPHRPHPGFRETNGHAASRADKNLTLTAR